MTLFHGGDIRTASEQYCIPVDEWIDLSTGINPEPYPVADLLKKIDLKAFERLPYLQPEFLAGVSSYYGNSGFLPVPGTQNAIRRLPSCLADLPVILPHLGYQEHVKAWQVHGSACSFYEAEDVEKAVVQIDALLDENPAQHLVVINPNNPTGLQFSVEQLTLWSQGLSQGGSLIVDEAFIDLQPQKSLLSKPLLSNMIVFRSFGKFFGLAGIRVGFVFANADIRASLGEHIGLWSINGPAQVIVTQACRDSAWQKQARINIHDAGQKTTALFHVLFAKCKLIQSTHQALFSSYYLPTEQVDLIFQGFAEQGILLRKLPTGKSAVSILRIGSIDCQNTHEIKRITEAIQGALARYYGTQ